MVEINFVIIIYYGMFVPSSIIKYAKIINHSFVAIIIVTDNHWHK